MNTAATPSSQGESKYRLLAELGQGATATVHLAVMRGPSGFNKLVVLKTLKRTLAEDDEFVRMFLREARLAARLSHPNIVQTNEIAEERGLPVIVMEYLQGQPLSSVMLRAEGKLPLEMHLRVIAEALAGLQYAHELPDYDGTALGLVHRDATPHNVFVTYDGQVKLLDFGIAKLSSGDPETQLGVIKGKIRYMPPEQIAGEAVDRRTDVYAMGVMLWEAAAGKPLWKGEADATIMNNVLNGRIPSPRSVRADVPELLEQICMKALAPNPSDRYQTAAELESAVESLLEDLGSRVSLRSVGKTVSLLFADDRKNIELLVDEHLSKVASLSDEEYEAANPLSFKLAHTETGSGYSAGAKNQQAKPRRKALLFVGAALLMGLGATLALSVRAREPQPQVHKLAPPLPAEPPTPAPAAERITIKISASPKEAKLYFNGEPLPQNPFERVVPADGAQHLIKAEAPGFETQSRAVTSDKNAEVTLTLVAAKPAAPSKQKTLPRATKPASKPPAPNCNPPYTIQWDGTKKFKVECL